MLVIPPPPPLKPYEEHGARHVCYEDMCTSNMDELQHIERVAKVLQVDQIHVAAGATHYGTFLGCEVYSMGFNWTNLTDDIRDAAHEFRRSGFVGVSNLIGTSLLANTAPRLGVLYLKVSAVFLDNVVRNLSGAQLLEYLGGNIVLESLLKFYAKRELIPHIYKEELLHPTTGVADDLECIRI